MPDTHMAIEKANDLLTVIYSDKSCQITSDYTEADLVIILTDVFEKLQSITTIADIQNNAKVGAKIIVTGDLVEYSHEELMVVPDVEFQSFDDVKLLFHKERKSKKKFLSQNTVVISQGCQKRCAYCPCSKKPSYRSKTIEEVLKEVEELCKSEITIYITGGLETSDYGIDLYGCRKFATLLDQICTKYPKCNYVIGWFHPSGLTEDVIETIAKHKQAIKEIMVHIQHVSDRILKENNRPCFVETNNRLQKLKSLCKDIRISTQVIVGLPGETDQEFLQLIQYLDTGLFADIGVSSYQQVEGTKAINFSNQIPCYIRVKRMECIRDRYVATPYLAEDTSVSKLYEYAKEQLNEFPKMVLKPESRNKHRYIASTDLDYKNPKAFAGLVTEVYEKIVNARDEKQIRDIRRWLSKNFTKEFRDCIYEIFRVGFESKPKLVARAEKMLR